MRTSNKGDWRGFTLLELMVALTIFLLVSGAAFSLLNTSQRRYQTESQVLSSFQEARLGLDQIVRDVNDAGYPPPSFHDAPVGNPLNYYATWPFAWSQAAGYPANSCQLGTAGGGTCTAAGDSVPGDFDLLIETNPNPQDAGSQVEWIRYQLQGTVLMRGVAPKQSGSDPDAAFVGANVVVPFVQDVVNNSPNLQVGVDGAGNPIPLSAQYPGVFPQGNPVPIFQYTCDTPSAQQPSSPQLCSAGGAGVDNLSKNIRDVIVTLIVMAPSPDATTGLRRLVQLGGRGRRVNPNQ